MAVTLAAFVLLLSSAPAGRAEAPSARSAAVIPPVRVSDAGPPPCPNLLPPPPRGANNEVSVASDPNAPDRLVAAWMINGASGVETAWSNDRGRSWHLVYVPGFSECSGREQGFVHDPWVSIGPDGIVYLVFKPGLAGGAASGITVTTSVDHGAAWATHVDIQPNNGLFNDKPCILADARQPGTAYASWNAAVGVVANAAGAIMTSRTVDGGRTWSAPAITRLSPPNAREVPHLLAFDDGTVENVIASSPPVEAALNNALNNTHVTVVAVRSTDHGATWSPAATAVAYQGSPIFGAATRGRDGWIAYEENTSGTAGAARIMAVHTGDAGGTWSAPVEASAYSGSTFPMVGVTATGVTVGFFDQRNAKVGASSTATDVWARHSADGGGTWSEEHLDGPFDVKGGLGDYQNATAAGDGVGFAYARPSVAPQTEPSDVYFALASLPGGAPANADPGIETTAQTGSQTASTPADTATTGVLARTGANAGLAVPAAFFGAAVALQAATRRMERVRLQQKTRQPMGS